MNKKMRELQGEILQKTAQAQKLTEEGEGKDLTKAAKLLDEVDALQKEFELLDRLEKAGKEGVPTDPVPPATVDGVALMTKMIGKKALNEREKAALITGENAAAGENYLVPEDAKTKINELRRSFVSARELVTVETTTALSGSAVYEAGTPSGLTDFEDGEAIGEEDDIKFENKRFDIKWKGKLFPISRILQGAEKGGLMAYIKRFFIKNATVSENKSIFNTLKEGYGEVKAVAGWEALKKSIATDLDPSCLIEGVIATNQNGFAALDAEKDENGRPILQPDPADPTKKIFQGLPIKVYPNAQLPDIDATHHPIFYGDTKAGATMVVHKNLEFAVSDHFYFNKNQTCMRVIEGYDTMSTDTEAYIYGSFSATV